MKNASIKMSDSRHCHCVILAGGSGERLWPLSRTNKPKQLLAIENQKTLLEQTIERMQSVIQQENIWICTTAHHVQATEHLVKHTIVEPAARNTAPALLLSCLKIYEQDPEAIVFFVPADSFIPHDEYDVFARYVEHILDFVAQEHRIALLGIKPTFAATGYGYIQYNAQGYAPYPVTLFHEKPSQEQAQEYIQKDALLWNSGMVCAQVNVFIEEYKHVAPNLYHTMAEYLQSSGAYHDIAAESFDRAVLEKSNKLSVLPADFSWCDVGTIEMFLSLKKEYQKTNHTNVVAIESSNNLIDAQHSLVALVGVHDLCIIQSGHVLLIVRRKDAEKIRALVATLKQSGLSEYV